MNASEAKERTEKSLVSPKMNTIFERIGGECDNGNSSTILALTVPQANRLLDLGYKIKTVGRNHFIALDEYMISWT